MTIGSPPNGEEPCVFSERKIDHDILILATGSQVNDFKISGVTEHCLLLDDLSKAVLLHQKIVSKIVSKTQNHLMIELILVLLAVVLPELILLRNWLTH